MISLLSNPYSKKSILNCVALSNKDISKRGINLHEYQAGRLLQKFRVPIPFGSVAYNGKEAYLVAK